MCPAVPLSTLLRREGEPVRAEEAGDLFRQGMPRVARATGGAERAWLTEAVARLEGAG